MQIYRLFVEKKPGFDVRAQKVREDVAEILGIKLKELRVLLRYDVQNITGEDFERAANSVFSEPPCDNVYYQLPTPAGADVFAVEYLPGQYDQRADSAAQCVQLLTKKARPLVRCATVYMVKGASAAKLEEIKNYLINPVESREAAMALPETLEFLSDDPGAVPEISGFTDMDARALEQFHAHWGLAMSMSDLEFVQGYFISESRQPTETELKVIDTYWSDHCRHTTFFTELKEITIQSKNTKLKSTYHKYRDLFEEIHAGKEGKYPCLMDMATIGAKKLKKDGFARDIDESEEINACSINVKVDVDGEKRDFLVMFKNETHNHPTEIEPYGGAGTCLGGAIRDPLSGRAYVYQAMRVSGAADITEDVSNTIRGKLPQVVISKGAAAGYSAYGNQIGLATGQVTEIFHSGYAAKRLEAGFVVGAAPKENVRRERPASGDVVVLVGGETGRDGCGGATGSSKAHDEQSVKTCGAEVQKGDPITERKIQRLFSRREVTCLIKRCNDFGAGGVCVAVGELADGLEIDLDAVPKKYEGLSGTELAISESQERMAVVISAQDVSLFTRLCRSENLSASVIAKVTDSGRMQMRFRGQLTVDLSREFLNTNGVRQYAEAVITEEKPAPVSELPLKGRTLKHRLSSELSKLNVCSQKGLSELFDSTVGTGTVYMPFGGEFQLTPNIAMAAMIPASGKTGTATVAAFACYPHLMDKSCFAGSATAVVSSVSKLVACGVDPAKIYLTFQEYFMRLKDDPLRWGKPAAALLGALYAQLELRCAAIGGKDSMSGTFENIDVPSTLISFALGAADAGSLITNVLGPDQGMLHLLHIPRDEYGVPDAAYARKLFDCLHKNINGKNIGFATVTEEGGVFAAVVKSALGNLAGIEFLIPFGELLQDCHGDIIVSASDISALSEFEPRPVARTVKASAFLVDGVRLSHTEAIAAFTGTLERVYRTEKQPLSSSKVLFAPYDCAPEKRVYSRIKSARPRVFMPVFPGTNCEWDTARKFEQAGAEVEEFLIKNLTPSDIDEAVRGIAAGIDRSQIVMLPGGFSGGDEPDGSGKLIATTFRNPRIKDSVTELLKNRDGLMLGICNGFQALIKLGLVPFGEITELEEGSPTIAFNTIGRHVSQLVRIRVMSTKSPWLWDVRPGEIFTAPVSHGEGRFVCTDRQLADLIKRGQIATQYADSHGKSTMVSPFNPNGSKFAAEGITSPCGRVFGKMGHSERFGKNLYKNCTGNFDMKIFECGVRYFK